MSEYATEPFDFTSDYDPDIPEVDEFKVAQAVAAGIDEDAAREVLADEATWQNEPIGGTFVVRWTDDTFSIKDEKWVSATTDMADCGYGDEVKEILAANEHGTLVPIRIGEQERVDDDEEEYPLHFAHAAVYAGNKRVGTVYFTDH